MDNKLTKIFQQAKYEPSLDLSSRVWRAVVIYEKRMARLKLWIFSTLGVFSFAGLVPATIKLSSDLAKSGLYEYMSLLFGSNGALASYWKDLAFSMAETLPVMSIVFALCLAFVLLLSIRYIIKQIGKIEFTQVATLSI